MSGEKDLNGFIKLKVGELTAREEAGRGIVRIDSNNMNKMNIKEGDVVEIEGSRKTSAIAVRAYPADVGLNIFLDVIHILSYDSKKRKPFKSIPSLVSILLIIFPVIILIVLVCI